MARHSVLLVGLLALTSGCGSSSNGDATSTGGTLPGSGGPGAAQTGGAPSGGVSATGGTVGGAMTGGTSASGGGASLGGTSTTGGAAPIGGATTGGTSTTGGATTGGTSGTGSASAGGTASGGAAAGGAGNVGTGGNAAGAGTGGQTAVGGQAGSTGGVTGADGGSPSSCAGDPWPTADPTKAGPFEVTTEKNVGPLAGVVPDPIYGDNQQSFNVYRPTNLADSGYCHPILIWANGFKDNPEQNPPDCVVDKGADRWCGQYSPMLKHLASHGFVVVASLSTATAEGDPLPTIVGLDWILEQAEDSSSDYYHHLDTNNIGQLGHSYGGMSTCMSAAEPRYKALMTICGTRPLTGLHTPILFFCGGADDAVHCPDVKETFLTVTDQPAFFVDEKESDHGSWVYKGPDGVSLSAAAAWFRIHLMGDTANRQFFYGPNCKFCTDNRTEVEQNSLMSQ